MDIDRREFIQQSSLAAGSLVMPVTLSPKMNAKKRMVLVGTGSRGTGFWGKNIINKYSDLVEFVGLCDINPGRVEYAKSAMGVSCPTFTDFDKMMQEIKPDTVIVTTVDATHHEFIVKAQSHPSLL
jgi:predicted dehydrogenase